MLSDKVQVASLFSTPLLTELLPGSDDRNAALKARIVERHAGTAGVQLSNVLGWQSDAGMGDWGGPVAERLLAHVVSRCDAITRDTQPGTPARRVRWITNMWANLSRRGASNQTHSHPGAFWSAIYYVEDGYAGSDDRSLGGELVFLDPRMPMIRARTPDLRYRRANGGHDSQESWLRPTSGRLVIFPSWLMHSVRPYQGESMRMSIAMNLTPRFFRTSDA